MKQIYAGVLLLCLLLSFSACQKQEEAVLTSGEVSQDELDQVKFVALTFDDGPRRGTTDVLLEGLRQRGVRATFFLIGQQIASNEDILRQMQTDGHQVGNHSYDHHFLTDCSEVRFQEEINKTQTLLTEILGPGEYWLRPPYGKISDQQQKQVQTPLVFWSVDPEDWKLLNREKVVQAVLRHVQDGDIILLHDFYPSSVQAALDIVDALQEQGYFFLTVQQLLRQRGIVPQPGQIYRHAHLP